MRYKLLGNTGLRVSELCLGTMTFGTEWGWGADKEQSKAVFDTFVEAGGNFIDTANKYTGGTSEKFCGEFIKNDRGRYVLATKYTLNMEPSDPNASGNHRKNLVQSVEASLKRLQTDYIDLLWLHAWDYLTPVEEVMRALDDLVRAGKVLYIGISDTPAWVVSQANTLASLRGWTPFSALQIEYSLIQRTVERELTPMARAFGMTVTPWGILGGGVLSGKYTHKAEELEKESLRHSVNDRAKVEKNLEIARVVDEIAKEVACTPSQLAIAWLRQQPGEIIPIIGARTPEQCLDNLGALEVTIGPDQMERLDAATRVAAGFPHEFLSRDAIKQVVFGDLHDKIDSHRAQTHGPHPKPDC